MTEGKWLTAKQVAARYGLTTNWVYHCRDLQQIGRRFGKYIRYPEAEVIAFEEKREVGVKTRPRTGSFGYNLQKLAKVEAAKRKKRVIFDIA